MLESSLEKATGFNAITAYKKYSAVLIKWGPFCQHNRTFHYEILLERVLLRHFFLIENDELRSSGENRRMVVWDVKLNYDLLDFFLYFQFFPFILSIYALESRSQSCSSCLVFGGYGDNCIFGRGHVTSYRIHFFKTGIVFS